MNCPAAHSTGSALLSKVMKNSDYFTNRAIVTRHKQDGEAEYNEVSNQSMRYGFTN